MKSVGGVEGDEFLYFWEPVVDGVFTTEQDVLSRPNSLLFEVFSL